MSTQIGPIAQRDSSENSLPVPALPARYLRFGAFQADIERQELSKNGQRVKVQSKLFDALMLLVNRAGQVVTREEVRRQLWPDTFLSNLDANVNTTINKLRQVLGDSPENPAYIETIPRRGYSFIASVEFTKAPCELAGQISEAAVDSAPQGEPSSTLWTNERLRMSARVFTLLFTGMILGALLALAWFRAQAKNQRPANDANVSVCPVKCDGPHAAG